MPSKDNGNPVYALPMSSLMCVLISSSHRRLGLPSCLSLRPHQNSICNQQHCYHHAPTVKPEAATAVVELFMLGVRTPETC